MSHYMRAERKQFVRNPTDFIIRPLQRQRETGELCDVVLCVHGKEFRAHKAILALWSPYFLSMFTCEMREKNMRIHQPVRISYSRRSRYIWLSFGLSLHWCNNIKYFQCWRCFKDHRFSPVGRCERLLSSILLGFGKSRPLKLFEGELSSRKPQSPRSCCCMPKYNWIKIPWLSNLSWWNYWSTSTKFIQVAWDTKSCSQYKLQWFKTIS